MGSRTDSFLASRRSSHRTNPTISTTAVPKRDGTKGVAHPFGVAVDSLLGVSHRILAYGIWTYARSHTSRPRPAVLSNAPIQSRPLLYLLDMSSGGKDIHPSTTSRDPSPACSQKIVRQDAAESLSIPPATTFSNVLELYDAAFFRTKDHANNITYRLTGTQDGKRLIFLLAWREVRRDNANTWRLRVSRYSATLCYLYQPAGVFAAIRDQSAVGR